MFKFKKNYMLIINAIIFSWRCFYYTFSFHYGLVFLWSKPWLWNIHYCWIGYPHQVLIKKYL